MNSASQVREKLRKWLAMYPRRRFPEHLLFDGVASLLPDDLTVEELKAAIEWNHSRNYIEYKRNIDREWNEWFLTEEGKRKEDVLKG